ncbi:hypothetical protein [Myxococcus sp. RHSTA-1-4]|uniref:hypothetical protein n=1 Tax=Myxococcus sp. RHSTA-1-4 TaxID=2874601 RepID=UPI001CBE1B61|nr:hypothetical protein [Myxococcus sp. RHSTA-1-4]MBZ4423268.1 hypothetical protein [Myxococcus sp. RHSTA-1-4]
MPRILRRLVHRHHMAGPDGYFAAAPSPPSAQAALADALLNQVEALRQGLTRYRTLGVMQEESDRHRPLTEDTAP